MGSSWDFAGRLEAASKELGVPLDGASIDILLRFLEQLQRWNKTYNLTAIRDPEQMLIQHIFDSLAVVPYVHQILYKETVSDAVIVDVGSGGGLPGVVLAAVDAWSVHCVDAVQKKMSFVRQMSGVLGLSNLYSHHSRVELLPPFEADIVISRAFASLNDFATLTGRHVGPAGYLLAMKGRVPDDEIAELDANGEWKVDHVKTISVPELDAQRCIVHLSRQGRV